MKTKVLFLNDEDYENVFAYFPEEQYHNVDHPDYDNIMTCYDHIGQHSACSKGYAKDCEKATKEQYINLYDELILIGYDLEVLNKDLNDVL